jgi:hypothetical protein
MSGKPESRALHARGRSGAARSQCDGANGNRREQGRMKLRFAMKTRALLTGIAALFLATGAAHTQTVSDQVKNFMLPGVRPWGRTG